MKFPEHVLNPTPRMLRQFAIGGAVLVLGIAAHEFFWDGRTSIALWLAGAAVVGGALCSLRPAYFRWFFVGAMVVAFPAGWIVSQVVLAIMFFGVMTPMALAFRIAGRDRLHRRHRRANATSFWTTRGMTADVRRYFRPY